MLTANEVVGRGLAAFIAQTFYTAIRMTDPAIGFKDALSQLRLFTNEHFHKAVTHFYKVLLEDVKDNNITTKDELCILLAGIFEESLTPLTTEDLDRVEYEINSIKKEEVENV